jgi:hypothetical protein
MTNSNRPLLTVVGIGALCAIAAGTWVGMSIHGLRSELESWRNDFQAMSTIGTSDGVPPDATELEMTDADAATEIGTLVDKNKAEDFAKVISKVDGWLVKRDDEENVKERIAEQLPRLRELVTKEVGDLQTEALIITPSAMGSKALDQAGRILALYPMSDDPDVIKNAKKLADRQIEAATRLDVLRRQRYNRGAIDQIEAAIKYFHENVKRNPINKNTALIGPLADFLGPIDPMLLEPVALELYNDIIDRTKGKLSEENQLELAKKLTDPEIKRKPMDDF